MFAYAGTLNHQGLEVEDTLVAVLRYQNGALGTLSAATSLYPGQPKVLELHGTKGTVRVKDDSLDAWQLEGVSEARQREIIGADQKEASGTFSDPMAMSFENHRRQFEDFLRAIDTDTTPLVDGREGLKSVELVRAIYRSAQAGKPVSL